MARNIKVTVTTENIIAGKKGDPCNCPVAKALRRAFKQRTVSAGEGFCFVGPKDKRVTWLTPPEVRCFISNFDDGEKVEPFTFALPPHSTYKINLPAYT